jgi:hypothetical protein
VSYAHYWSVRRSDPAYATAWPGIIDDTRRIIEAVRGLGVVVAGPDGHRRPVLDPTRGIAFNGDATTGLRYESFVLAPPTLPVQPAKPRYSWAFCKTDEQPYDLAVTAVLLRCRLLLPGVFLIASDGEWAQGVQPGLPSARSLVGDLFGDVPADSPFHPGDMPGIPGFDD